MQYFGYIVLSLVILLLMVLIHELGHYTMAKILGFTVDEFSVGFGPKLLSRRRKNGELFSLRMLPLGGFCAFYGETDDGDGQTAESNKNGDMGQAEPLKSDVSADSADTAAEKTQISTVDAGAIDESKTVVEPKNIAPPERVDEEEDLLSFVMKSGNPDEKERRTAAAEEVNPKRYDKNGAPAKTFNQQKPWKRIIVLLGGVLFNFLSAIVFSLIYIWVVGYAAPCIDTVYADEAGVPYCALEKGDIILAVDGKEIGVMQTFDDVSATEENKPVVLRVLRGGKELEVEATRKKITVTDEKGKTSEYVGFGFVSTTVFVGNNAKNAFTYCVPYTFKLSWSIIGSFGQLITGKIPITLFSGPVGSINTMAQLSQMNWRNILILLPLLASNLAIFNILPIPALDGARIVFTVIEWIRKKPIDRKIEGMIHMIGMVVLVLFVVVVDILSFAL